MLAAGVYISLLFGTDIWYDEAYTFGVLRHSYSEMWRITAADVHPPLYYILLKLFVTPFSDTFTAAKVFSMIPMLLIIIIGGVQLKGIFDKKVSLCFMVMFLIFPFMVPYAVEIRMYSLAALFVFMTAIWAYKSYDRGKAKDSAIMLLSGVAAAYTHYFALVAVGIIYFILLICILKHKKHMLRRWIICVVLSVVLYLPWLGSFIAQLAYKVENEYWIDPINMTVVERYITDTFNVGNGGAYFIYFTELVFIMLLLTAIFSLDKREKTLSLLAITVWGATILAGVAVSLAVRPIFVIRYSVPTIPVFLIFASIAIARVQPREIRALCGAVLAVSGILNYTYLFCKEYNVSDIIMSESFTERYGNCDSYIICNSDERSVTDHFRGVLAYYETDKPIYSYQPLSEANPFDNCVSMERFLPHENQFVIMLKEQSYQFPTDLMERYNYIHVGRIATDTENHTIHVYMLMNKDMNGVDAEFIRTAQKSMERK